MTTTAALRAGDPSEIGSIRLLRLLGEGGQGAVFLGEAPDGQRVAVKVLHARLTGDERARRLFLRESSVARSVEPYCTARVLAADVDGDRPYIVSEYVEGESLSELVRRAGPRDPGGVERLAIGTAAALRGIHRAGIVHRDFKPSNVLLSPDGPRVIDFGIARAVTATTTMTSGVVGTPAYMSPEQVAGGDIGPPSDVFSWAVTMTFAATGGPVFGTDGIPAVLHRVLNADPDLSALPPPMRTLLAACLAKDPARRPTMQQVLAELLGDDAPAPPLGPVPPPWAVPPAEAVPPPAPVPASVPPPAPVPASVPASVPLPGTVPPGQGTPLGPSPVSTARPPGSPRPVSTGRFAVATTVQLAVAAATAIYAAVSQDDLRQVALAEALFMLVCFPVAILLYLLPRRGGR